CLQYINSPFTF
nr:immunoglobulin light chain junction region [Macaca mulatta]